MRLLVTGASGRVGSAIAAGLLQAGHEVTALSRRSCELPEMAAWVSADVGQPGLAGRVKAEVPRCDVVVHAAAAIDHSPHNPDLIAVNALGTQQVVELAGLWDAALVYLSSVPVVGQPDPLPVTEEQSVDPPTAYHATKLLGEHLVELARRRGIDAATFRITSPVGPGAPDGRILSVFVQRALAGEPLPLAGLGGRRQDYVDVRDIAAAVCAWLPGRPGGVFNIAAGRAVSNRELAERVIAGCGSASAVELTGRPDPSEAEDWEVSIERAVAAFGYAPAHTLEDSIAAVVAEQARIC